MRSLAYDGYTNWDGSHVSRRDYEMWCEDRDRLLLSSNPSAFDGQLAWPSTSAFRGAFGLATTDAGAEKDPILGIYVPMQDLIDSQYLEVSAWMVGRGLEPVRARISITARDTFDQSGLVYTLESAGCPACGAVMTEKFSCCEYGRLLPHCRRRVVPDDVELLTRFGYRYVGEKALPLRLRRKLVGERGYLKIPIGAVKEMSMVSKGVALLEQLRLRVKDVYEVETTGVYDDVMPAVCKADLDRLPPKCLFGGQAFHVLSTLVRAIAGSRFAISAKARSRALHKPGDEEKCWMFSGWRCTISVDEAALFLVHAVDDTKEGAREVAAAAMLAKMALEGFPDLRRSLPKVLCNFEEFYARTWGGGPFFALSERNGVWFARCLVAAITVVAEGSTKFAAITACALECTTLVTQLYPVACPALDAGFWAIAHGSARVASCGLLLTSTPIGAERGFDHQVRFQGGRYAVLL